MTDGSDLLIVYVNVPQSIVYLLYHVQYHTALFGRVFTVGHCSIPPYSDAVLHCSVRTTGGRQMPSGGLLEGLTLFAENTGLIGGRTLVDPSRWKVPVLVLNFSQDTVVVAPFSEVGMIAQVAFPHIQPVMELRESPLSSPPASPASPGELDYSVVLNMVQKINN